jgi:hypothetical protein
MVSSTPPSSRLRPAGDSALEQARGELRDALGGLKNLDQLLRSLRVGPRALVTVIPDVHAACAAMRCAVTALLHEVGAKLGSDARATDALRSFVLPRITTLEAALATAMNRAMSAKNRLDLERVVSQLARDLDCARELLDLLEEATSAPGIRLDLLELLQQTFKVADPAESGLGVRTALDLPAESIELYLSPRVAMALFTIAAEFAGADGCPVRVAMRITPSDECSVAFSRDPAAARAKGQPRHVIEPIAICLEAVAHLLGARFEAAPDQSAVAFTWPEGSSTSSRRAGTG